MLNNNLLKLFRGHVKIVLGLIIAILPTFLCLQYYNESNIPLYIDIIRKCLVGVGLIIAAIGLFIDLPIYLDNKDAQRSRS